MMFFEYEKCNIVDESYQESNVIGVYCIYQNIVCIISRMFN